MENRSRLLSLLRHVRPLHWSRLGLACGIQIVVTQLHASVTVRWQDNADNETGFRVERSSDGGDFAAVATLAPDLVSYEDLTVTAGCRYWYRIAAFNAGGDSDYTEVVSCVAPGGPVAAPNSAPTISAIGDRTVTLGQSPGSFAFTVGDAQTPAGDLILIGNTSNPLLVPPENLRFAGSGASRTLTVTPMANATGWTTIWVKVSDGELTAVSSFVLVVAAADTSAAASRLSNLSARGRSTPTDPLTLGFVVNGAGSKRILVRAIGPTLGAAPFLVPGVLSDPQVTLMRWGGTGYVPSMSNQDWCSGPLVDSVRAAALAAYAFTLPEGSGDAAFVADVPSGQFTALIDDQAGGTGVGLVELYEADEGVGSRFVNLSTRAHVGTGGEVLIVGFVVEGSGTMRILVRAVGPGIGAAPFRVPGTLPNPELMVYQRESGGDSVLVFRQDDWNADGAGTETAAAAARVGAFALASGSQDAAAVLNLGPGAYTAVVRGVESTTGTALVELYDVTDPQ